MPLDSVGGVGWWGERVLGGGEFGKRFYHCACATFQNDDKTGIDMRLPRNLRFLAMTGGFGRANL